MTIIINKENEVTVLRMRRGLHRSTNISMHQLQNLFSFPCYSFGEWLLMMLPKSTTFTNFTFSIIVGSLAPYFSDILALLVYHMHLLGACGLHMPPMTWIFSNNSKVSLLFFKERFQFSNFQIWICVQTTYNIVERKTHNPCKRSLNHCIYTFWPLQFPYQVVRC